MLLLLDIGNTAVTYGIYQGKRLLSHRSIVNDDIPKLFHIFDKSGGFSINNVVISTVVPQITHKILKRLKRIPGAKIWVVGKDLKVPINHKYNRLNELGIDRQVNIFGALKMHNPPLLLLDYGTALTVDYISSRSVFEGGMIIPGPETAFQSLIRKAALLPKKSRLPKKKGNFLGRNTADCLRSGILEGYGAMTDELVARYKRNFGNDLRVMATGGFAMCLKAYVRSFDIVDPQLSIKSLFLLFEDLQKKTQKKS